MPSRSKAPVPSPAPLYNIMANPLRGEVDIRLAGKAYTLRPTFQALCELEQRAGSNLYHIARRFEDGSFTLLDITCVVWSGIRGTLGASAPTFEDIGEHIVLQGVANMVDPACRYMAGALGVEIERTADGS